MTARLCSVCSAPLNRKQRVTCSVACRDIRASQTSKGVTDEQEAEIVRLRTVESLSTSLIADRIGVPLGTVGSVLRRLRLPVPAPEKLQQQIIPERATPEQIAVMREMYTPGEPFEAIQARVNALPGYRLNGPHYNLSKWAQRLGLQRNSEARSQEARRKMTAYHANKPKPAPKVVVAAPDKPKIYAPSRAKGEGPPPPPLGVKPRTVPLHTLCRIGCELGLKPDDALDYARVSAEMRRADPTHPGFRPAATNYGWEKAA